MTPKILLVEDNQENARIYRTVLEFSGYVVKQAVDGQEALNMARAELPDLILMDISIPVLNGWEATSYLKADDATSHIPIIALTAHTLPSDREKSKAAGCDGFLAKPIGPIAVLEEVARWVPMS